MVKKLLCVLLSACLLYLGGCARYPDRAADGTQWDKNWTMLGSALGVEEPGDGFALLDNSSVLTGDDLYYAAWAVGEPTPYTNEDGQEVDLYEAQLYLLLCGFADGEHAQQALEDWMAREQDTYTVIETRTETRNGRTYTLLIYTCGSETNPYSRGVSAFSVCGNYTVSAELACRESYTGQETEILLRFLGGCHYSEELD